MFAVGGLSVTLPLSAGRIPERVRRRVVFPAPFAPTRPITSPGATTRSSPVKRLRSPCPAASSRAISVALIRAHPTQCGHRNLHDGGSPADHPFVTRLAYGRESASAIRRDWVMLAAIAAFLLAGVLLFVIGDPNSQVRIFWLAQPPLDFLLMYSSWQVFRVAKHPVRRFWRLMGIGSSIFLFGDTVQAVLSLTRHGQWSTAGG